MGYICSKCKEKPEDDNPADQPNLENSPKNKSPQKKMNTMNYAKLNVNGVSPYSFSDNRVANYNSDEIKLSHMEYESFSKYL